MWLVFCFSLFSPQPPAPVLIRIEIGNFEAVRGDRGETANQVPEIQDKGSLPESVTKLVSRVISLVTSDSILDC